MDEVKDDSSTKETTNVFGTLKNLGASGMEAAYNEKVYLFLRALLNQKKHFNVESDNQIKIACNRLYTTWENYLDNDNADIQLQQLKEAYSECKPLVEKKFKNYVDKKTGKMAEQGIEKAKKLKDTTIQTARKTKEQILQQSKAFAKNASEQYKKALLQTVQTIKNKIHSLSGPLKEKALDKEVEAAAAKMEFDNDSDKQKYIENLKKFSKLPIVTSKAEQSLGGHSTIGGARLTRKRKRKRKKRKTRRNRKLN
jgi:hypothetical protein